MSFTQPINYCTCTAEKGNAESGDWKSQIPTQRHSSSGKQMKCCCTAVTHSARVPDPCRMRAMVCLQAEAPLSSLGFRWILHSPDRKDFTAKETMALVNTLNPAHATCKFQKEQIVSLEARRVALLGEILGKRCSTPNAPQKTFEHCCHVSYQLDTAFFLWCWLPSVVRRGEMQFPQIVLQGGAIIQVPIS